MAAPSTRRLIPLLPSGQVVTGTGSYQGDGTWAGTGVRVVTGTGGIVASGDWSGSGTLTSTLRPLPVGRHVLWHHRHGIRRPVRI